jgi:glycosyltransferase involved in cell wall biosynthesis
MYDPMSHPTDIDRVELALALLDAGITNIRLYGGHHDPELNGWVQADPALIPYIRPEASVHETVKVARMAKVVVNTSAISPNPIVSPSGYWSDRLPMTLLTGTLCLTDNAESLGVPWEVDGEARQLVDGEHVVSYSDVDDCVEKCRELLADDERRETIASAGREFARAHLTEDEVVPGIILPALEALFEGEDE